MHQVFNMVLWEHVICGGQFWEKGGYTLDDTMRAKSDMEVRQVWRAKSDRRGHHGIAPLEKCGYSSLVSCFPSNSSGFCCGSKKFFNPYCVALD